MQRALSEALSDAYAELEKAEAGHEATIDGAPDEHSHDEHSHDDHSHPVAAAHPSQRGGDDPHAVVGLWMKRIAMLRAAKDVYPISRGIHALPDDVLQALGEALLAEIRKW